MIGATTIVTVHILTLMLSEAAAITPPDTSLDTLPVGYFGGVNCKQRLSLIHI